MNHATSSKFGHSDIIVSKMGFGAGHIGSPEMSDFDVERLLNFAADEGVNFFDTARGYGLSEERVGRLLEHRRHDLVYSTKVGYGIPGYRDWTYDCIVAGVEQALRLLRTDYIDICFLHSCPMHILQEGECTYALLRCKDEGKIRLAGYSGENEELKFAVSCGAFQAVQTSYNVFEQYHINNQLPEAIKNGIGIVGKRPLANAPWRFSSYPEHHYCAPYWKRMREMGLDMGTDELFDVAVRFSAYSRYTSTAVFGTSGLTNLNQIIQSFKNGPLPEALEKEIMERFERNVSDKWGQI